MNITIQTEIMYPLLFFIIYSFLGWVGEVAYAYKNQKKFVNRGFLFGPYCPIYGASLVLLITFLTSISDNIFIQYILATIITSTIEYLAGYILEKSFKRKYWDYTEDPFNLHGRICLHFSLMWGAIALAIVKIGHPLVAYLVGLVPIPLITVIFIVLFVLTMLDFILTLCNLLNVKKHLGKLFAR
ncbi:MAG: putative ABC transporter permease [Clostridium sp.]|nr:putative ABC transporter permease [Clostridium sp.]MDY3828610.1 putative ABC transporter permease [Clostridium sp.]